MQISDLQQVKQKFGIIGNDSELNRAIDIAVQVSSTDLSVLITGESGVGKENFSKIIHQYSRRKNNSFIAVNCGAIPEGTIDSELFGHEKGSFTGAVNDRKGYFEYADGGTIFLDEVGELPLTTQARLLRVLEVGEFIRVGASKVQKTNVRVIAATNINILDAIKKGKFREDLYYRLNTIPIHIPSLRERKGDIHLLFRKFAADFAEKYQMPPVRLTEDAQHLLINYSWPGNIRQLKNITEQISIIEQNREVSKDILLHYIPQEETGKLPTLFNGETSGQTFNSEREILYQVLFDMKRDINELRSLVQTLMNGGEVPANWQMPNSTVYTPTHQPTATDIYAPANTSSITGIKNNATHIEDTEEFIDETLSLDDNEKNMIAKALKKHHGKRRAAAEELKISERTLYRKIIKYGLED